MVGKHPCCHLLLALLATGPCYGEAASGVHADPHWSYEDELGWGTLPDPIYHPQYPYAECGIGHKQSPVDIHPEDVIETPRIDEIKADYPDHPLSVTNNGHTLRVNISKGRLIVGHTDYDLVQFHFHSPSEHLLNGQRHALEVHFVNGTPDGRLAVLAVFGTEGRANHEFQKILDAAPAELGVTVDAPQQIAIRRLLPKNANDFYSYSGSLTTPPCTEGIQWYVLRQPIELSRKQIDDFKARYYSGNIRSEQRLNGRKIAVHHAGRHY